MRTGMRVSLLVVLLASLLAAASAQAAPKVEDTFDVSGTPGRITEGPDGNVWVLLSGSGLGNDIAKVEPNGTVTEFDSNDLDNAVGITAGPDDKLWVTKPQAVASFDPGDPTVVDVTAVAAIGTAQDIVSGPDGNLWTTGDEAALQIPPADPANPVPHAVPNMFARGIAAGGDGRIWIADFNGQRIIRMKTDGTFTEYAVGGGPQQVAAGANQQIAFTNPGAVPQVTGLITPPNDPKGVEMPNTDPFGVTFGRDGAFWTARFAGNDLARVTPDGKQTSLGGLPAASGPRYLTAGPGGTLWVSLETGLQIAKVSGLEAPKAPKAKITKAPNGKVKTDGKRAKVKFAFESNTKGATFKCSLETTGEEGRLRRLQLTRDLQAEARQVRVRGQGERRRADRQGRYGGVQGRQGLAPRPSVRG